MIEVLSELSDSPLPQTRGPKLNPFFDPSRSSDRHVRFLRLLGGGGHGYVFEVTIGSQRYALKIFKFYNPLAHQPLTHLGVPSDAITPQVDPFFAECRAFGRLIECGLNGDIGVHCYGYIKLPVEFEGMVARTNAARSIGGFCWDRPSQDGPSQLEPFRGIVKELVSGDPFVSGMAEKMGADLLKLSNIGVYPIDIKEDNYRGGRLTDFSASWTRPHVMLSVKGPLFAVQLQKDLLDKMIQGMIRNDSSSFTTDGTVEA
ncbi:MAG: hypothetical protein M1840_006990 [Geoglossum simile]|nr:MAG: hypothetical protein M1840_006990 [Geoglossum simile]